MTLRARRQPSCLLIVLLNGAFQTSALEGKPDMATEAPYVADVPRTDTDAARDFNNSFAYRASVTRLMYERVTPTRDQADHLDCTGVHESPSGCAISAEAIGANSIRCAEVTWSWDDDHHPRRRSQSLPTVPHASQATLVQARACNAARADSDLIGTPWS